MLKSALSISFRLFPSLFWRVYATKARALGFDDLYLVLSFDCDTDEDIPAAQHIHEWLGERGARGVFAVPGVQLRKGARTFQRMAKEGAEFINHGAAAHTEWRDGRYWSVTFYDRMSREDVERDIRAGHEIVAGVTGKAPSGFRAPHFGHFQMGEQLTWLYGLLRQLGYRYASTTLPRSLLRHGPCADVGGLVEFPVTGRYSTPLQIFDSWGYLRSPHTRQVTEKYGKDLISSAEAMRKENVVGIANYYVDPAHVVNSQCFFKAVEYCQSIGFGLTTYTDLLGRITP
jgi:hypothetical protein